MTRIVSRAAAEHDWSTKRVQWTVSHHDYGLDCDGLAKRRVLVDDHLRPAAHVTADPFGALVPTPRNARGLTSQGGPGQDRVNPFDPRRLTVARLVRGHLDRTDPGRDALVACLNRDHVEAVRVPNDHRSDDYGWDDHLRDAERHCDDYGRRRVAVVAWNRAERIRAESVHPRGDSGLHDAVAGSADCDVGWDDVGYRACRDRVVQPHGDRGSHRTIDCGDELRHSDDHRVGQVHGTNHRTVVHDFDRRSRGEVRNHHVATPHHDALLRIERHAPVPVPVTNVRTRQRVRGERGCAEARSRHDSTLRHDAVLQNDPHEVVPVDVMNGRSVDHVHVRRNRVLVQSHYDASTPHDVADQSDLRGIAPDDAMNGRSGDHDHAPRNHVLVQSHHDAIARHDVAERSDRRDFDQTYVTNERSVGDAPGNHDVSRHHQDPRSDRHDFDQIHVLHERRAGEHRSRDDLIVRPGDLVRRGRRVTDPGHALGRDDRLVLRNRVAVQSHHAGCRVVDDRHVDHPDLLDDHRDGPVVRDLDHHDGLAPSDQGRNHVDLADVAVPPAHRLHGVRRLRDVHPVQDFRAEVPRGGAQVGAVDAGPRL